MPIKLSCYCDITIITGESTLIYFVQYCHQSTIAPAIIESTVSVGAAFIQRTTHRTLFFFDMFLAYFLASAFDEQTQVVPVTPLSLNLRQIQQLPDSHLDLLITRAGVVVFFLLINLIV